MAPLCALRLLALCLVLCAALPPEPAATPGCRLYPFEAVARGASRCAVRLSACVGFCESSAFPSRHSVLRASGFRHNVTSLAQCCSISRLDKVQVPCGDAGDWVEVFTARSCQCDMCRLSRY